MATKIVRVVFAGLFLLSTTLRAEGKADTPPDTLPFQLFRDFIIVAPVYVNGKGPYEFHVDTGTNTSLIETALAEDLGLQAGDRMELISTEGARIVPRSGSVRVALGGVAEQEVELLWDDLARRRSVRGRIRGVLGQNFLSRQPYLIDYRRRVIRTGGHPDRRARGGIRVALEMEDGRVILHVPAPLENDRTLRLVLDSGAPHLILFGPSRGGAWLPWLQFGPWRYADVRVTFMNPALAADRTEDGLLATSLFEAVYVDSRAGYVILYPRS